MLIFMLRTFEENLNVTSYVIQLIPLLFFSFCDARPGNIVIIKKKKNNSLAIS